MRLDDNIQLVSEIGSGGMGAVWRARHEVLKKDVAVKLLHKRLLTPERLLRFRQEAQLASSLKHPNIVQVYSFGKNDDLGPYIVMELIQGESLDERLRSGTLSPSQFTDIFSQCCRALQYAHEMGVIHRDIKPANIMLTEDNGDGVTVKVGDFGIAKFIDETRNVQHLTQTGEIIGTPLYMSPEACGCEPLDSRSDIYSLGCVMYHAIAGTPPHTGENPVEVMMQHLEGCIDAGPLASAPEGLRQTILLSLSRQPQDRQQTMSELLDDIINGKPSRVGRLRSTNKRTPRHLKKVFFAAVTVSLTVSGVFVLLNNRPVAVVPTDQQLLEEAAKWTAADNTSRAKDCYYQIYHDAKADLQCQLGGDRRLLMPRMTRTWSDSEIDRIVLAVQRSDKLKNLAEEKRDSGPWEVVNSLLIQLLNRGMWKLRDDDRLSPEQQRVRDTFSQKADAIAGCVDKAYKNHKWTGNDSYNKLALASDLVVVNGTLQYQSHDLPAALETFQRAAELRKRAALYVAPGYGQPRSEIACYLGEILTQLGSAYKAKEQFEQAASTLPIEERMRTGRADDRGEKAPSYARLRHRVYGGLTDTAWLCGDGSEACIAMRTDLERSRNYEPQEDLERERSSLIEAEALLGRQSNAKEEMGAIGGLGPLRTNEESISKEKTNILAKQALALSLCGDFDQSTKIVSEIEHRGLTDRVEASIESDQHVHLRKLLALMSTKYAKATNSVHMGQHDEAIVAYEDAMRIGCAALHKMSELKQPPLSSDVTTAVVLRMVARDYASLLTKQRRTEKPTSPLAKVDELCRDVPAVNIASMGLLGKPAKQAKVLGIQPP